MPLPVGRGVPEALGYSGLQLFAALAAGWPRLPGPVLPHGRRHRLQSGRKGNGLTLTARSGCFQGTGSGRAASKPSLNVLPWLSALGGVASGSWERASGFGPWDSRPCGGGFSQAPLVISPTDVHTQDRLGQGRGPAGPYRESYHLLGSGPSSGLGTETGVLGLLCLSFAM